MHILNKEYDHGRVHALRRRLREIPDGLDKLFEDILTRDQENMGELVLCLQWILYAKRPLKQDEIYHAILSGTDPEALSALNSEEITAQDMERFILSCSKGLAETTKLKAQRVQFIHESVRDYLLGKNGFNKLKSELRLDLSHDRLKQCCHDYMGLDTSAYLPPTMALPVASSEEARGLRELVSKKLPFLEYAVRNVLYHADVADGQGIPQKAFVKQFALSNWIMLDNLFEKYQLRRHTPNVSLTYIVAEKNFGNLVQIQVESDHDPDTVAERLENERYAAPLYAALANANVKEETIQALFLIPVARTYGSGEHPNEQSEQSDCEIERNRAAIQILVEKRPNLKPGKGETLIGWAASNGHEAVVKLLLARDNINLNPANMCPLLLAAARGHAGVVKLLLARDDVDPNLTDSSGITSLSLAAEHEHEAVVKLLLARDDINLKSPYGNPLLIAAEKGHAGVVKLLLARDDVDPNLTDSSGITSLSLAAEHEHEAVVKLLLARDDINLKSPYGNPLLIAAEKGHAAIVKLLLSRINVDPNSKGIRGETLLSLAPRKGHDSVVKLLLARDDIDSNPTDCWGQTPLSLAAEHGRESIVKLLLARDDIDSNPTDCWGQTPLSLAAEHGHEAVVRLLLSRTNVNPNSKDVLGNTSLSLAVRKGHDSIVKLLLTRDDVDPDSKDEDGQTPLSSAVHSGYHSIIKLLITRDDVDLNSKDNSGRTPLSWATWNGYDSTVKLLLTKHDIDLNVKDNSGKTLLSLAAWNGHVSIVDLLLSRTDIDPNLKDIYGQTPLSLAATNGYESIIGLLLARDDIDSNSTDMDGQTPLSLAAEYKQESIVKLLLAHSNNDPNQKCKHG